MSNSLLHVVFEDLLGLHASQSKIRDWKKKKKRQAERQGPLCQVAHIHPFLGCCPRSQLKTRAAREKDVRLQEYLKELNQQTGLKTNSNNRKQHPKTAVPTYCINSKLPPDAAIPGTQSSAKWCPQPLPQAYDQAGLSASPDIGTKLTWA